MAWIVVAVALSVAAWGCSVPAPELQPALAPVPTLEATPEWPPAFPPRDVYVVGRSESSLAVVWSTVNRATYYDVQRSSFEDRGYAIVATKVAALGPVDQALRPDGIYY